jgi:aquaporin Z
MNKLLTEFIGTFFFVLTICLVVLGQVPGAPLFIGLALAVMVYMGGSISGGHYNPAVSIAAVMRGALPARELGGYITSQLLAAIAAAAMACVLTGETFAPMPGLAATSLNALLVEALYTFALVIVVLNVAVSPRNAGNSYFGAAIGLTIAVAAAAGGEISGGAFNPAVAIGPTVVHALFGGGSWSALWIYLVGPITGGVLAAIAHRFQER